MLRFIFKRLFYGFLVIIGVVCVVFFLFNMLPGDPARMILGQRSDVVSLEAINKELGRDKPLLTQFLGYINDVSPISVHNSKDVNSFWYLDEAKYSPYVNMFSVGSDKRIIIKAPYLKRSYQSKRKVTEILLEAIPNTAILAFAAMTFAFIVGVLLGIVSAVNKDTWIDKTIMVVSVFGMSLPSFFAAIIIAWLFAYVLVNYTGLNMCGSLYYIDDFGNGEYFSLKNLILPAFTLGIRPLAVLTELTRNSMLDVLSQDYIRTAKAKGLSNKRIIFKHALKNALNPVITATSGWFASLMAGAVFVEYVFDWKGVGVVLVDALEKYDFPVVMGSILLLSIILVVINIVVDILYKAIDPRIQLQ